MVNLVLVVKSNTVEDMEDIFLQFRPIPNTVVTSLLKLFTRKLGDEAGFETTAGEEAIEESKPDPKG